MYKSFFKPYLVTFLFILCLASFSFAGNNQCPADPPPPPPPGEEGGRMVVVTESKPQMTPFTGFTGNGNSRYVSIFVEFLNTTLTFF
jgi:hypothetical protein